MRSQAPSKRERRLGLLMMLLAALPALAAEEAESRTERFAASLAPGATLSVANVSGDIVAREGSRFSATVEIRVFGPTRERAREVLDKVRVIESREGENYRLETRWPGVRYSYDVFSQRRSVSRCGDCKITVRYELTVPPGVEAKLSTVNGNVTVGPLDGELTLSTVNGKVQAAGARRSVVAHTVNGSVEVGLAALPRDANVDAKTVNGSVLVTLPKTARFDLTAWTMGGAIASTFDLARSAEPAVDELRRPLRPDPRTPRLPRRVVVAEEDGEPVVVDMQELEAGLAESLREVEVEVGEAVRHVHRRAGEIRILDPRRLYRGQAGGGGANVRLTTLNGPITVLASGTRKEDAKTLVAERAAFVLTLPRIEVRSPKVRVELPRVRVQVPAPRVEVLMPRVEVPSGMEEDVERGDVAGDFLSTTNGNYKVGRVAGRVKILTHWGEIRLAAAGKGADVKTLGGDIRIGSVAGDLRAHTLAGDIRVASVTGSLFAETSGGDIRAEDVSGAAEARTAGGDVVLEAVGGSVTAETSGGNVRIGVVSREVHAVAVRNSGGDVTLVLPSDFRGEVELIALGSPGFNEELIRSDFPELVVIRRPDSQRAAGTLNGGGAKVVVRTTSGAIRLRKGPAAP